MSSAVLVLERNQSTWGNVWDQPFQREQNIKAKMLLKLARDIDNFFYAFATFPQTGMG